MSAHQKANQIGGHAAVALLETYGVDTVFGMPGVHTLEAYRGMDAAGIRHVGFNIRKANNRQGPGLFNLAAGKLTVVLADQEIAKQPGAKPAVATATAPAPVTATAAATATAKAPAPAVAPNAQARAIVAQSRTGVGNAPARPASSAAALRNATRQAVPK